MSFRPSGSEGTAFELLRGARCFRRKVLQERQSYLVANVVRIALNFCCGIGP